jgi:hypothetical protein
MLKILFNPIVLLALIVFSAAELYRFYPLTIDDAYITFAYSKNAALGHGFVFARGEHVEATSSFLWALLLVPFELLGFGSVLGAKLLGLLFFSLSLWQAFRLTERVTGAQEGARWFASPGYLAALVTVCSGAFLAWTVQGLENALIAYLMILALDLFSRELNSRNGVKSFLPIALLETARPEGFIFVGLFVGLRILFALCRRQLSSAWLWKWIGCLGLFLACYEAWGFLYYGQLLPNTVGAKVSGLDEARLKAGWEYLTSVPCLQALQISAVLLGLALVLLPLLYFSRTESGKWARYFSFLLPAGCLIGPQLFFGVLTGGDWMPGGRFVSHLGPVIGSTLVIFWALVSEQLASFNLVGRSLAGLWRFAVIPLILWYGDQGRKVVTHELPTLVWIHESSETAINPLVEYANRTATPEDVLSCSDVGRLGYYFNGRIFDWWGLASPEVVQKGEALGAIRPETVLAHKPRFIIIYSGSANIRDEKGLTGFGQLSSSWMQNKEFLDTYEQVLVTQFTHNRYHVLFERKKSPLA